MPKLTSWQLVATKAKNREGPPAMFRPGPARKAVREPLEASSANQQQQTGMSFIIRQQVQPDFIMWVMHSQHA